MVTAVDQEECNRGTGTKIGGRWVDLEVTYQATCRRCTWVHRTAVQESSAWWMDTSGHKLINDSLADETFKPRSASTINHQRQATPAPSYLLIMGNNVNNFWFFAVSTSKRPSSFIYNIWSKINIYIYFTVFSCETSSGPRWVEQSAGQGRSRHVKSRHTSKTRQQHTTFSWIVRLISSSPSISTSTVSLVFSVRKAERSIYCIVVNY